MGEGVWRSVVLRWSAVGGGGGRWCVVVGGRNGFGLGEAKMVSGISKSSGGNIRRLHQF